MNSFKTFSALGFIFASLILVPGCKKKSTEPAATGPVPVVVTGSFSNLLLSTVHFAGNITSDGGIFVTKRGFCWSSATKYPTIQKDTMVFGNGAGSFSGTLKGLKGQTTYYICAFATNNNGTGYGNITSVTTIDTTITDVNNNHYRIVQIGTQVWMAENLKTTKFNDGTSIPLVTDNTSWANLTTPGYCWYNNDAVTNKNTYGALYNWYAGASGNLAPAGWHVPTYAEWATLITYLGDFSNAGGKLKETGTIHWLSPNYGATNETGFTALPGGDRIDDGTFADMKKYGNWWNSSEDFFNDGGSQSMAYNNGEVFIYLEYSKIDGYSVRCIRN